MDALNSFSDIIITLSGGKDSTSCLFWGLRNLDQRKITVVFQDSGVENPETHAYIDMINNNVFPVTRLAGKTFWDWFREIGRWPNLKWRWCTRRLKTDPFIEYLKAFENPVVIFGMRRGESRSRSRYNAFEYDPLLECCRYHPIIYWDERTAFAYLVSNNFPINPAYNYARRVGCWPCPLGRPQEIISFARVHPKVMAEAVAIESEVGHTWRADISLSKLESIAKSQGALDMPIEGRCNYLQRTLGRPLDSFKFPKVTAAMIAEVLRTRNPRGSIEVGSEDYIQLILTELGEEASGQSQELHRSLP